MVSTQEQETLQLRALKLQTPIKGLIMGTFPLSSFTLRGIFSLHMTAMAQAFSLYCLLKNTLTQKVFFKFFKDPDLFFIYPKATSNAL